MSLDVAFVLFGAAFRRSPAHLAANGHSRKSFSRGLLPHAAGPWRSVAGAPCQAPHRRELYLRTAWPRGTGGLRMKGAAVGFSEWARSAAFACALIAFAAPPVEALEFVNGAHPAEQISDGLLAQVRAVRHGGARHGRPAHRPAHRPGGGHRPPAHRPPAHRPPVHRPPVARPPVVVTPPRGVWVGRPGWYRWAPGGAIAAGAAIGFVTAATAAAWAGAPPQPGLCWYYTDPTRRQGFWDACP